MPAYPSRLLDWRGATSGRGGCAPDWGALAPCVVNETKAGIVAVMQGLGRPTTSPELHAIWGKSKPESVIDYHLSTLARAGFAEEIVGGPELRFRLAAGVEAGPMDLQGRVPRAPQELGHT